MFNKPEYYDRNLSLSPFYEKSFMHAEIINLVAASPASRFLATASLDGKVKFWRKIEKSVEFVKQYKAHKKKLTDLTFSFCGSFAASVSNSDNTVKIYDVVNADMMSFKELDFSPNKIKFVVDKITKSNNLLISEFVFN